MVFEENVDGEARKRKVMKFEEKNKKTGSGNTEFTEMSVICQRAEITLFSFFRFSLQSLWSGECHRMRDALFSQAQDECSREEKKM